MLNEKQEKAIYLLTHTNMKKYQVAKEIDVVDSTISKWFKVDEFAKKYDEEMRNAFKELSNEAMNVMLEILTNGEKESNRLSAAKDILSRGGYDASQKVEQVSETTIKVTLDDDMEGGDDAADKPTA